MVLRCSLLGHDFGDPDVEREREERGSEVVVTVREYEECDRCGERHVVSENTEVTSLEAGASSSDDGSRDDPDDALESAAGPDVEATDGSDIESADESDEDRASEDDGKTEPGHPAVDGVDDPATDEPVVDDAEIIEDEPSRDRERGEWPDSDDVGPPVGASSEPAAWPEADDVGADDVGVDDGVEHPEEAADASPEAAASSGPEAGAATETDPGTGIASAQSAPVPGETAPPEGVPTEFYCPQCAFVAPVDRGSLRPGDICPECRKGYLSERER